LASRSWSGEAKQAYGSPAMCALRGPTPVTRPSPIRTREPPPTPTVRTSRALRYEVLPRMVACRTATFPRRTTLMSVEVPPVSRNTPSLTRSCISAPATPAAGPDRTVRSGRRRISSSAITPPSQRITIRGAVTPALVMEASTRSAVASMRGRIAALTTAVRVRLCSPYSEVISCAAVIGSPYGRAASSTARSPSGRSTLNGWLATRTWAPSPFTSSTARRTAAVSRGSVTWA
jgi:hypothetical protein